MLAQLEKQKAGAGPAVMGGENTIVIIVEPGKMTVDGAVAAVGACLVVLEE
jgi:hypothetical protein